MTADTDTPKHLDEDTARQKYILSVLAFGSVIVLTFLDITILYESTLRGLRYGGISFLAFTGIVLFYILILLLTRRNIITIPAHLFVGSYFVGGVYTAYSWGVSMPSTLLIFALTIIITGILLGHHKAFIMSALIVIVMFYLGSIESKLEYIIPWKTENIVMSDIYAYSFMLCLVTVISWLYNKEVRKSLNRARNSERDLQIERDQLDEKVQERTAEIYRLQMEHMKEVYRVAEFGRISSGFFHDLINPLTTLSATVQELSKPEANNSQAQKFIDNALKATQRMEYFMYSIRKRVKPESGVIECNIQEELESACLLLQFKAKRNSVEIVTSSKNIGFIKTYPVHLQQIFSNLISNAIDSYKGITSPKKKVVIELERSNKNITIRVKDNGCGMDENTKSKLFTPFFTTKDRDDGLGIGLATVHNIVHQNLSGSIEIKSEPHKGTTFIIKIPINGNQSKINENHTETD